jgi:S-(hydroxymethyl)glutathione dehydrogenase/alcohol dehydrogenase
MKAVVVHELNRFAVENVELAPPKAGEVKVKMVAAGVCHSDLSAINGTIPQPLPLVLGHEGAASSRRSARASSTASRATTW